MAFDDDFGAHSFIRFAPEPFQTLVGLSKDDSSDGPEEWGVYLV